MIGKITRTKFYDILMLVFLLFCTCELFYNRSGISGKYSIYVSLALCISLFILDILKNKGIIKINIWYIFAVIPLLLYKFNTESIRYSLFFLIVLFTSNYKIKNLGSFFKILIIIAFVFSLYQMFTGTIRISGFMISPTIFSCTLCIAILYLLFEKKYNVINLLFSILALFLIYMSESSSTFVFGLALFIYKTFINLFINRKKDGQENKKRLFLKSFLFLSVTILLFFMITHLNEVLSIISRSNRGDSTNTRLTYYFVFIKQLVSNPLMILIGKGAGYTQQYIHGITTIMATHYPLHQDFLMLICEYGLIGMVYIYNIYIKKLKMNWLIWLLIILCSFHNLILTSTTMCLIILVNNSLNSQYNEGDNLWR